MTNNKIKHGGNLREAAKQYNIPLENWIDLSTGITPRPWRVSKIPSYVWQRLPESDDDLLAVAQAYYACDDLLPIAGSQIAIQSLPYCRKRSRVAIVSPCYAEHPYWWQKAEHEVLLISADDIEKYLPSIDVLLLINPNNPDTHFWTVDVLQQWHQQLSAHNGWLIVDEAFMDSTSERSLLNHYRHMPRGLIVLRSIGKFFGLAGIRLGFIAAASNILQKIEAMQGPWAVSHPARYLGQQALSDQKWQVNNRKFLREQSKKLHILLSRYFKDVDTCHYFCFLQHHQAIDIQYQLAKKGIWIRYFEDINAIRLGLPANSKEFQRLDDCFSIIFR